MKKCWGCGKEKDTDSFSKHSKRSDGLQTQCKECHGQYCEKYYKKNKKYFYKRCAEARRTIRLKVDEYLGVHPCVDCGESDIVVLEFDHVSGLKLMAISSMSRYGYSWIKVLEEISKCDVRCANCHRRVTYARSHTSSSIGGAAAS